MVRRWTRVGSCAALAALIALLAADGSPAHQLPIAHPGNVGIHCRLTAALPTEANDQITGTGSIRCKTSRALHVHIETQMLQQGHWESFGSLDGYVNVRRGRMRHVSTGPANCKGLGQAEVRTVLRLVRFPQTIAQAASAPVAIACSTHQGMPGPSMACVPDPQPPTSANGQISASGTARCSAPATLDVDLQLQVYNSGSWQQVSDTGRGGFAAAANITYSFTTPATVCGPPPPSGSPPPPAEQWRSVMMTDAGAGPITNMSAVVVLTPC